MIVQVVPCWSDNYCYLLKSEKSTQAVVVDTTDATAIIEALDRADVELIGILNTHHHPDHMGGNAELVARFGPLPVFGHASDKGRIPEQNRFLEDGDQFEIAGLSFGVMHVPGHTTGAVAYTSGDAVFTGDTLFAGGCGRLFEGTPEMMYRSLNERLAALPDATRVYCGHEYTVSNLTFAAHVEPGNLAVQEKLERSRQARERGEVTVPSTLAEERKTNPFLRVDSEEIIASMRERLDGARDPVSVLGAVRAAKDAF